ncbi:serine hydrolase [Solibacillus sp. R5-41]|uniref:serine hydrolase n=1 Tax=Solibacillus sp. R5-41 TaxID=2048654 RepID=UPI000C125769|nr:serine hydrolase [Solibacillus sp. R5-41]ATP41147.1 serine hydrolase [Solibacillus sp. R5-41]
MYKQQLAQLLDQIPYRVHVIIQDYRTNESLIEKNTQSVFSSASVIKVPILMAVLHHLEKTNGQLSQVVPITSDNVVDFSVLTEQKQKTATLHELLLWMIITSDNTATNMCIDFIGIETLNYYFQQIGLKSTSVQRKMMDFERQQKGFDNVTTARDMQHLFHQIYAGKLLAHEWNEVALNILLRQRSHESLKRYLVDDVKIAHKTGGLDTVDHDVGIVFTEQVDYFIGVFLTEVTDNEKARQYIGQISKIAYAHFQRDRGN